MYIYIYRERDEEREIERETEETEEDRDIPWVLYILAYKSSSSSTIPLICPIAGGCK